MGTLYWSIRDPSIAFAKSWGEKIHVPRWEYKIVVYLTMYNIFTHVLITKDVLCNICPMVFIWVAILKTCNISLWGKLLLSCDCSSKFPGLVQVHFTVNWMRFILQEFYCLLSVKYDLWSVLEVCQISLHVKIARHFSLLVYSVTMALCLKVQIFTHFGVCYPHLFHTTEWGLIIDHFVVAQVCI